MGEVRPSSEVIQIDFTSSLKIVNNRILTNFFAPQSNVLKSSLKIVKNFDKFFCAAAKMTFLSTFRKVLTKKLHFFGSRSLKI